MTITPDLFRIACPTNAEPSKWAAILNDVLKRYPNIAKNPAHFLAQTGHESADYKARRENLNYSAAGLLKTFPRYFTTAQAQNYSRQPQMIANRVYANRMSNGNEASCDGWRFRGGGLLQLTGRANYTAFGKSLGITAEAAVEYIITDAGAVESACWYWTTNGLHLLQTVEAVTKRINGGVIGLADRRRRYERILRGL